GVEFDALMEDVDVNWRQLIDVAGGALKMQLRSWPWWKFAGVTSLLGVLVACGLAMREPTRYVATARIQLTSPPGDNLGLRQMAMIEQEVLSDSGLEQLIREPSLNLYEADQQKSMEAAVAHMRRDLRFWREPDGGHRQWIFDLEFRYPVRAKAQAATHAL